MATGSTDTAAAILTAIRRRGRGWVFTPTDLPDAGTRRAVDLALGGLVRRGTVRRLAPGVYDVPEQHPELGLLLPTAEAVAHALARRDRARIQPTGAFAANALGLSDQVPAKVVFLTDGPGRTVKVGPMTVQFRRASAEEMAGAGRLIGLLVQALGELGEPSITPARRRHLRRILPAAERRELVADLGLAPAWMHPILRELAEPDP